VRWKGRATEGVQSHDAFRVRTAHLGSGSAVPMQSRESHDRCGLDAHGTGSGGYAAAAAMMGDLLWPILMVPNVDPRTMERPRANVDPALISI
jgi:hypothetical protein